MPQSSISILRWERRSIRRVGANGTPAKPIHSTLCSTLSSIQRARVLIMTSVIRIRIFLLQNRPNSMSRAFFCAAAITGIRRSIEFWQLDILAQNASCLREGIQLLGERYVFKALLFLSWGNGNFPQGPNSYSRRLRSARARELMAAEARFSPTPLPDQPRELRSCDIRLKRS
jgi:hypothetical protein